MKLPLLDDLDVRGKRVLVRLDLNVPLKDSKVADDTRIRAALPTIEKLLDNGATVICCSHLGRPKGKVDPDLSLMPVAQALADRLSMKVRKTEMPNGPPEDLLDMPRDQLGLLENLRFDPREEANDPSLAMELASLGDAFVNDAFGAVHRAHASVVGIPPLLPSAAGYLLQKEVEVLEKLIDAAEHPFVLVLGGVKVSDKLGVVRNLIAKADSILIGGAMANTFLAARGIDVGASKIEEDRLGEVKETVERARASGTKIELPADVVVATEFSENAASKVVRVERIPRNAMALDIGPLTCVNFSPEIAEAKTVFWNGPMGVFEWHQFSNGTREVAHAVVSSLGFSVIGGGDSIAAINSFGLTDRVTHISTGGGASLEFLEGKSLPGLEALTARS